MYIICATYRTHSAANLRKHACRPYDFIGDVGIAYSFSRKTAKGICSIIVINVKIREKTTFNSNDLS